MNRNRNTKSNRATRSLRLRLGFPNRNTSVAARINNRAGRNKREHHFFSFVVLLFSVSGIP
jgi:hypothetical protein